MSERVTREVRCDNPGCDAAETVATDWGVNSRTPTKPPMWVRRHPHVICPKCYEAWCVLMRPWNERLRAVAAPAYQDAYATVEEWREDNPPPDAPWARWQK